MMKGTEGLIYEERLKKPKTQSQAPAMTSGNTITDSRHLKGVNHQCEDECSVVPKTSAMAVGRDESGPVLHRLPGVSPETG